MRPADRSPPGRILLAVARAACDAEVIERVVAPCLADLQAEWIEARRAGRRARAAWIHLGGALALVKAIALVAAHARLAAVRAIPLGVLGPALAAGALGAVMLRARGDDATPAAFARNQLLYLLAGALAGALLAARRPSRVGPVVAAALSMAIATAVLVAGESFEGAQRWISLGPLRLQAAPWIKPLFAIALAGALAGPARSARLVQVGALLAGTGILIALEPDAAAVLALVVMVVAGAWSAGVRRAHVVALGAIGAVPLAVAAIRQSAPPAASALASVGHALAGAGLWGHGWTASPALGANGHTDEAIALVAHRAGILGLLAAAGLLAAVIAGLVQLARSAPDPRSRILATSVAAAVAAEVVARAALGEGMIFLSYGGSSLVATFALLALAVPARPALAGAQPGLEAG